MRLIPALLLAFLVPASSMSAQTATPAAMDSLLGRLVGRWSMTGTVRGQPVIYVLDARRVLGNRFVELHMTDVAGPSGYEARVFLGVDSVGPRYIVHWLDRFGAAYSIPPAIGEARGDTVRFAFAYADGPFRDLLVYNRANDTWYFRLEAGASGDTWNLFAEYQVRRAR